MRKILATSSAIDALLHRVAMSVGWLFLVTTFVIVFDVVTRKVGYQLPSFGSTRVQELEWYLHTAIFSFWLGLSYVRNAHVRIDILLTTLSPRRQAWTELLGCIFLALPYCIMAIYFSVDFTWIAFVDNEMSPSTNGLHWRWIPKCFISVGLIMLLAGVISVMLRTIVFLFGPEELRKDSSFGVFKVTGGAGKGSHELAG